MRQEQQRQQQQEEEIKTPEEGNDWEVGLGDRNRSQNLRVEAWKWVKQKDVMSQRMAKGLLFYGWQEAEITFPPSFKWRVGASAGDYTDRGVLQTAYVTRRRGETTIQWPPSYTDRILISSQSEVADRHVVGAYDMCDEGPLGCVSDHRPVSQALMVMVETSESLATRVDMLDEPSISGHAGAAAVRQRKSCLPRLLGSSPKTFPMLVTLTMSRFSFVWAQQDGSAGIAVQSPSRQSHIVRSNSREDSIISEGSSVCEQEEQLDLEAPSQPVASSSSCPPCPVSRVHEQSSPGVSAFATEVGFSRPVDHALIIFPVPSEDPLLSLRLAQALGESFGSTSSLLTGRTMSTGGIPVWTETLEEGSVGRSQRSRSDRESRTRQLQNIFRVQWTTEFECRHGMPALPSNSMEGTTPPGGVQNEAEEAPAF